ncbi:unnamed protein product [Fusarium equiseti]|uniref:Ferric oxidoreductase domain-containing protein n=1 Tax=Fusarium equiseti TaxID=61235 RepID=A0A8J2N9C8_FUSEQ|nr:unnamed protein product [Fusarium equiseti]
MPTTLDCPEYAKMSAEERAAAYPSAACFGNDTSYLTSIAWCISSYCPKTTKAYKIEYFWGAKMIHQAEDIKYSYAEALAEVGLKKPPKPMSPDATVLNRTISIDDATYSLLSFLSCVAIPIGLSLFRFLPIPKSIRSKFYAYIIDPPAWGRRHSVPTLGLGIVPTRGQALFILYIIALNASATFEGYPRYTPNAYFPDRRYELMRHIGNRAGIIAFANVPIIMLYAGRNSLLLRLTNWSYSTFILLHRWVAMVCVIQVILHSLMWLQIMVEAHSHSEVVKVPYWQWGIVGTLAFSLLLPFSILPFRRAMYEIFLILHIVFAVIALVGSWYHICRGQMKEEPMLSSSSSQAENETKNTINSPEASLSKEVGAVAIKRTSNLAESSVAQSGITLFVSIERGLTSELPKKADTGIPLPILVESSYGHEDPTRFQPTTEYPNTLCIAGGVGVSAVLPALQSSLSIYARSCGTSKLYWGIKNRNLVDAVKGMIVSQENYREEGDGRASDWGHFEAHVTIGSRIDIKQVLATELKNAEGGTTVIVCGPLQMCDDARYVYAGLACHGAVVRYVEESFSW